MRTLDSKTTTKPEALNPEPFLNIEGVSKVYETPKGPYIVLDGVNLAINEGEFICLIGHSGCGKSTLLNMIAGFNQPTDGQVRLKGERITEPGPDRMVVFQNYSLLPWLSATENIHLAVESVFPDKPKLNQMNIVTDHLEMVGLTEAAHKRPGQLSGGMKQRVAIARALATRPQLLILDEPFGALDPITREELQEELLKIWSEYKVTIIMITHDIDEALFLADRVVMMTNGPSAHIGEDLKIPFSRPRDRARIMEDPKYYELRNFALDFLFRRFAHSEVEEEASTAPSSATSSVPQPEAKEKIDKTAVLASTTSPAESSEPSPRKGIAFGAAWLATIIGLTAVSVGSVANLQKESAQTETTAVSASPAPIASPPPSAMSAAPSATASANSAPVTADATPAAGITDKAEIETLKQKLYSQIDETWKTTPTFTEDLVYRVKVKQDGGILQYEATNKAAKDYVQETPLASVQNSATSSAGDAQKTADFRVAFSPSNGGVLDVKPWE